MTILPGFFLDGEGDDPVPWVGFGVEALEILGPPDGKGNDVSDVSPGRSDVTPEMGVVITGPGTWSGAMVPGAGDDMLPSGRFTVLED